jgi:hypothetical protein
MKDLFLILAVLVTANATVQLVVRRKELGRTIYAWVAPVIVAAALWVAWCVLPNGWNGSEEMTPI